jgi:hypothetical protein
MEIITINGNNNENISNKYDNNRDDYCDDNNNYKAAKE